MRSVINRLGKAPRSIKVVFAVCLAVVLLALFTLSLLGIRHGAPWIPKTPPVETLRVVHPEGFSVIPPPGWVVKFYPDLMTIGPGSKGIRYAPGFGVTKLDYVPELAEFQKTAFLEMEAYENIRFSSRDEVTLLHYRLLVRHKEYWYEVAYSSPAAAPATVPNMMMHYLRSFRPAAR
jgi:hypothetical protein